MGRDKASLQWDGRGLLERTVIELQRISDDLLVIGRNSPVQGARAIEDETPGLGPVGGLLTGLHAARYPLVIATACDHPFLDAAALSRLVSLASAHDAVVPVTGGLAQPLHAVYRRSSVAAVQAYVAEGRRSLTGLLETLSVRWVHGAELAGIDPDGRSLLNVNTPEEWENLRAGGGNRGSIG
jgi:molybdopterin-guanine dinucleotide biosynthesis protein A